jgi:hypothetical protein
MMNDPKPPGAPLLPYDDLRHAAGDDASAQRELDALHQHLAATQPDPAQIRGHVDALRGVRDVEARIANWWDDPETQRWIKAITDAGL